MPHPPRFPSASASWRCRVAFALTLVLVLAQSLGFMHRVAHGSSLSDDPPTSQAIEAADSSGHWVHELFAGHDDDVDCPLFDSLTQPAGPAAAIQLALALSVPSRPLAQRHGDFVSRWASLFDARGPPSR